jgi:hypothetical protein
MTTQERNGRAVIETHPSVAARMAIGLARRP